MSEILRLNTPPEGFLISTFKYGETKSVLIRDIEVGSPKIEGVYKIEVPEEVTRLCQEVKGLGGRALLVGGSIRDCIISAEIPGMNLRPKDFDLEVYGIEPADLMKILGNNFDMMAKRDLVGKSFQVINVNIAGWDEPLNISIPRIDSKVGKGHADGFETTACPWMNIKEAAQRRDIRPNSCAYDPLTETLYNPYEGVEGIKNRVIEITDNVTFQDDALRIMRIMQFAGRFEFEVSEEAITLCKEMVLRGDLDELSKNRIAEEMKKLLLKSKRPSLGMKFALETGIVEKYWPEFFVLVGLEQELDWHPEKYVWEHSLQVMDAAALIADREGLDKDQKMILVLAALCHDLGKATTTKFEDGRIRSRGHEEAGVEPTLLFLSKFAPEDQPNSGFPVWMRNAVAALVNDHLKPKYYWEEEVKKGKDMTSAIRRRSRHLAKSDTNMYMLSLLAEADQRGRNGEGNTPKERQDVEELIIWQVWLNEKINELQVIESAPVKICTSKIVMDLDRERKGGPWVSTIIECVYQDQMDGVVIDVEGAVERAAYFYTILKERTVIVARETGRDERSVWEEVRGSEDPRLYCVAI